MNGRGIESGRHVASRDRVPADPAKLPDERARIAQSNEAAARRSSLRKPRRDAHSTFILHTEKWR